MTNQACPLCDTVATFKKTNDPYGKLFTCQTCREFFIDPSSEAHLAELPEVAKTEFRLSLSKSSKSGEANQLFIIREPRNDELGGDGHGIARTQLIAEWITRSE